MPSNSVSSSNIVYFKPEPMKGDCLRLLKFLGSDIFQTKIIKVILMLLFLLYGGVILIQFYFILYVFNKQEFINYLAVICGTLYALLAISALIIEDEVIAHINEDIPLWSIDSAGPEVRDKIATKLKLLNVCTLVMVFLTFLASLLQALNLPNDEKIFFALHFFQEYFPNQSILLCSCYKLTFVPLGYLMIVHAFQIVYYCQHINIQMNLLQQRVQSIGRVHSEKHEEGLFYNAEYQKRVRMESVFCIERGEDFMRMHSAVLKVMKIWIAAFSIMGCILGISIAFYLTSDLFTPDYYPRLALTLAASGLTFCVIIWSGQETESMPEKCLKLFATVKWYNFDKDNKTLYLIAFINLQKERKINFSENYSINYKLALVIVRNIFSVVSVLISLYNQ